MRQVRVGAAQDHCKPACDEASSLEVKDHPLRRHHLGGGEFELIARDLLIDLDVAMGAFHNLLFGELWRLLILRGIEAHLQECIAHILLREFLQLQLGLRLKDVGDRLVVPGLHLRRDFGVLRLPLLHAAHSRGVGRINLVNDVQLTLLIHTELILGVNEDEAPLPHQLGAPLVKFQRGFLHLFGHVLPQQLLHLFEGHILVMAHLRLRRRGEKWRVELLKAVQAVRYTQATERTVALLIGSGHAAPKVTTHDELDHEILHLSLNDNVPIDILYEGVRHNVLRLREGPLANHVEELPLKRNQVGQDVVKCRHAVVCDHHDVFLMEVDIPDLAGLVLP
mmetsp:Transcript_43076/g.91817  ORF Transcript_43076/g.91817 Transcript_43076/m.91817 type:complete len:337 (-) Transcript_43076:191-1201(-)